MDGVAYVAYMCGAVVVSQQNDTVSLGRAFLLLLLSALTFLTCQEGAAGVLSNNDHEHMQYNGRWKMHEHTLRNIKLVTR